MTLLDLALSVALGVRMAFAIAQGVGAAASWASERRTDRLAR